MLQFLCPMEVKKTTAANEEIKEFVIQYPSSGKI
jgi:hypothetical protein